MTASPRRKWAIAQARGILRRSPIPQPYAYLGGGSFSGPVVPESPNPLVAYRWPNPKPSDALQIYLLRPKTALADPPHAFANFALSVLSAYETKGGPD